MTTPQRQYEPFTLFQARIVDMRHLWLPSDTYKGQKQQKANYFAGFIVQKTQAQWQSEPALAGLIQAFMKLYANNPQIVDWRIENGDTPNAEGKSSEFAKGHWLFNGSSGNPISTELVQPGGQLVKLTNRTGVKPGDYCVVGGTAAVSGQNNRAAKIYLNAVVFSSPGEEIVFANSVSGAELMAQAQAQGLRPAGFPGSAGFGGAPGGFQGQPQQPFGGAPGGFAPQQQQPFGGGAPGFTPGNGAGFAPIQGNPAQAPFANPPNGGAGGGFASPFNGQPQQQPFQQPQQQPFGQPQQAGQFGMTPNGWPQR